MTINQLTEKIIVESFNRETLERLLTKEIKKKVEFALNCSEDLSDVYFFVSPDGKTPDKIISETLKSE